MFLRVEPQTGEPETEELEEELLPDAAVYSLLQESVASFTLVTVDCKW